MLRKAGLRSTSKFNAIEHLILLHGSRDMWTRIDRAMNACRFSFPNSLFRECFPYLFSRLKYRSMLGSVLAVTPYTPRCPVRSKIPATSQFCRT